MQEQPNGQLRIIENRRNKDAGNVGINEETRKEQNEEAAQKECRGGRKKDKIIQRNVKKETKEREKEEKERREKKRRRHGKKEA